MVKPAYSDETMQGNDLLSSLTFSGRTFSGPELKLIQEVCRDFGNLGRTEISRTVCELLEWKRPNGGLKNHECRLFLERMERLGVLELPEVSKSGQRGKRRVQLTSNSEPESELTGSAGEYKPLILQIVEKGRGGESRLWRELVERYHYLGCRVPVGANLRYLVRSMRYPGRILACLLWTSPAWKIAVRDDWIGWNNRRRQRNLQLIINNGRFLILPWVRVRGLASKILACCARQIVGDWEKRFGYRPLLLETMVDTERFRGTCYRAANWMSLGHTQGRGRMDRQHRAGGRARKEVFVYPLCQNVRERLQTAAAPVFSGLDEEST
jgi:hypothetical protein